MSEFEHLPIPELTGYENPLSPALWAAIKAFSGRQQVRHSYAVAKGKHDTNAMAIWRTTDEHLTQLMIRAMQQLADEELSEFMERYRDDVTRGLEA